MPAFLEIAENVFPPPPSEKRNFEHWTFEVTFYHINLLGKLLKQLVQQYSGRRIAIYATCLFAPKKRLRQKKRYKIFFFRLSWPNKRMISKRCSKSDEHKTAARKPILLPSVDSFRRWIGTHMSSVLLACISSNPRRKEPQSSLKEPTVLPTDGCCW